VTAVALVTCGVGAVLYLALMALIYPWVIGLISAINGEYRPMPWFGKYVDKYFGGIVADKRPNR
jgi:hypothetical protein